MKPKDKCFDQIRVGDSSSFYKRVTEKDVIKFSEISGDYNPLHLDDKYASKTIFKGRIVYGMFMCALISRLVGMELPGKRSLLVKECLEFKAPVRIGNKILVKGTVLHKSSVSQTIELSVRITRSKKILVSGSVFVKILSYENKS